MVMIVTSGPIVRCDSGNCIRCVAFYASELVTRRISSAWILVSYFVCMVAHLNESMHTLFPVTDCSRR